MKCRYLALFLVSALHADEQQKNFSQFGQDTFVNEHFFKNKLNGVFIDIGASDGITLSNTYFFEKCLGWSGICFEPRPDKYAELRANRSCVCINGCVAEKTGNQKFLFVQGYAGDLSGLVAYYDPQHAQRIDNELRSQGGSRALIMVACYQLMDIVRAQGITHVDYLSIDTEGNEFSILKTINFNELIINVIDVENNYGDTRIADFLVPLGYELVAKIACDEIYKRKS